MPFPKQFFLKHTSITYAERFLSGGRRRSNRHQLSESQALQKIDLIQTLLLFSSQPFSCSDCGSLQD